MRVRSNQAVNQPAAPASANHGASGPTSRRHERRPRFHQKTTNNAAGSVAVTVLVKSAMANKPVARA